MGTRTVTVSAGIDTLRERWKTVLAVLFALFGLKVLQAIVPLIYEEFAFVFFEYRLLGAVAVFGPHWIAAGVIVAGVVYIERRGIDSIGVRPMSRRDFAFTLGAFVLGFAVMYGTGLVVKALGLGTTAEGTRSLIRRFPTWALVVASVTAGVTEEILYRGYPIERLEELTDTIWIAAVITILLFAVGHYTVHGVGGIIQIIAWSGVITALYIKTRNLFACILMHTAQDLLVFLIIPFLA